MDELPEWAFRGGHFRSNFSGEDVPTPWSHKTGEWKREEMVPYGKSSEEYRQRFYRCPDCEDSLLEPSETMEYRFVCKDCRAIYAWSWGGLHQRA